MVEHRLKEKLLYVLYVIVKTVGLMEKQTSSQINDIFFGLNNHKSESQTQCVRKLLMLTTTTVDYSNDMF